LINQAYQGDKITAEAESYAEAITIKYGIQLIGTSTLTDSSSITGGIKLTGFYELTNLYIEGFTISGKNGAAEAVIQADNDMKMNNLEIKNCILDGGSVASRYAFHGSTKMRGTLTITGTTF